MTMKTNYCTNKLFLHNILLTTGSAPQSPQKNRSNSEPQVKLRSHTVSAGSASGLVQRLSMGYEQLEANAKITEIQLGAEGR